MRVSSFKKFLESNSSLYEGFKEAVIESVHNVTSGNSFSYLYHNYRAGDPDKDYNVIQDEMNTNGFTIDVIKGMFSSETDFLHTVNMLDSENGYVDIYLYKTAEKLGFNKNLIFLGGDGWTQYMLDNPEEAYVRYSYGCHKTKYGRIMMEQAGLTEKELLKLASSAIYEQLNDNWINIFNILGFKFPFNAEASDFLSMIGNKTINDYYFIDDDRVHIFLSDIVDDISKAGNVPRKECMLKITKNLKMFFINWDIEITNDEFVVWLN